MLPPSPPTPQPSTAKLLATSAHLCTVHPRESFSETSMQLQPRLVESIIKSTSHMKLRFCFPSAAWMSLKVLAWANASFFFFHQETTPPWLSASATPTTPHGLSLLYDAHRCCFGLRLRLASSPQIQRLPRQLQAACQRTRTVAVSASDCASLAVRKCHACQATT